MPERSNIEKKKPGPEIRERQIPNKLEVVCGRFFALTTDSAAPVDEDALPTIKKDAQLLSDEIVEITELLLAADSNRDVQNLEKAGDVLVILLGYLDMLEMGFIELDKAIGAVQQPYERYKAKG